MVCFERKEAEERILNNTAHLIDEMAGSCTFVLNLGVGIPTRLSSHITNPNVYIEAENGLLGVGPLAIEGEPDWDWSIINAGRQTVKETPGCVYLGSAESFGMMRGGHIDATVLGAFSVDEQANISNWIIPGGKQLGVGGAMDLVSGCKKVIVAMTHCNKQGEPKLIKRWILPVTGFHEVDFIVTEYCMMRWENGRFVVFKMCDQITVEELRRITGFNFDVASDCEPMLN